MEMSLKNVIRGVFVAAAASAAMAAHADVAAPSSGNGELTLFVRNETTQEVYARGLQITLNNVITEATTGGAYSGPTQTGYALPTIGPDATLTAFLSSPSASGFTWGLLAGDSVGAAAGQRRWLLTSQVDMTVGNNPSNNNLGGLSTTGNTFFNDLNANLPDTAGSSVRGTGSSGGLWGAAGTSGEFANTFFGLPPQSASGSIGDSNALKLFVLANSSTSGGALSRVFEGLDVALSADGTLHSVSAVTPTVPLPAAVWLFGSGLLGLVGVGRRKA